MGKGKGVGKPKITLVPRTTIPLLVIELTHVGLSPPTFLAAHFICTTDLTALLPPLLPTFCRYGHATTC